VAFNPSSWRSEPGCAGRDFGLPSARSRSRTAAPVLPESAQRAARPRRLASAGRSPTSATTSDARAPVVLHPGRARQEIFNAIEADKTTPAHQPGRPPGAARRSHRGGDLRRPDAAGPGVGPNPRTVGARINASRPSAWKNCSRRSHAVGLSGGRQTKAGAGKGLAAVDRPWPLETVSRAMF